MPREQMRENVDDSSIFSTSSRLEIRQLKMPRFYSYFCQ